MGRHRWRSSREEASVVITSLMLVYIAIQFTQLFARSVGTPGETLPASSSIQRPFGCRSSSGFLVNGGALIGGIGAVFATDLVQLHVSG